jgi:hypothetical protein
MYLKYLTIGIKGTRYDINLLLGIWKKILVEPYFFKPLPRYEKKIKNFDFFLPGGLSPVIGNASELNFSNHTLDKATKAKVTLENYYSNLILQHKERNHR